MLFLLCKKMLSVFHVDNSQIFKQERVIQTANASHLYSHGSAAPISLAIQSILGLPASLRYKICWSDFPRPWTQVSTLKNCLTIWAVPTCWHLGCYNILIMGDSKNIRQLEYEREFMNIYLYIILYLYFTFPPSKVAQRTNWHLLPSNASEVHLLQAAPLAQFFLSQMSPF